MALYDINWSARLSPTSSPCPIGQCIILDPAQNLYVFATAANRASLGRKTDYIALSAGDVANNTVVGLSDGNITPAQSGLGAGLPSWGRVGSTGFLERVATPTTADDVVCWVEADGSCHCKFGFPFGQVAAAGVLVSPGAAGNVLQSDGAAWFSGLIANANVAGGAGIAASKLAPPGANKDILINDASAFGVDSGSFTWDKALRSLVAGAGAATPGNRCFALGAGAIAGSMGDDDARAFGDGALAQAGGATAIGPSAVASQTYCIAIGYLCTASAAAAVAIGEECTASGTNAVSIGFNNTCSGNFAVCLGSSLSAEADYAVCLGFNSDASRAGQLSHGSGHSSAQGLNAIDLYKECVGAAGNLVDINGNELTMAQLTGCSMTIKIQGEKTAGDAKFAHELHALHVRALAGPTLSIDSDDVLTSSAVNFAAAGWTLTISAVAASHTLRIHVDPGADDVRVLARVEWSQIGNL